jgi:AmiR/NasT family two-component response regulator
MTQAASDELQLQVERLRAENEQLRTALHRRVIIEQAKGAASARLGVTPDEAFELIRSFARSQRRNIHEFAAEIVAQRGHLDGSALR